MDIKRKRFVVIPRDALELMVRRFAELGEATEAASQSCAEDGQTVNAAALEPRCVGDVRFQNPVACPHEWPGPGPMPARWDCKCGTIVYRSYEAYCWD